MSLENQIYNGTKRNLNVPDKSSVSRISTGDEEQLKKRRGVLLTKYMIWY